MTVREIMTAQPKTASRNTTLAAAAQLLWGADCGILPVVDGGKLVGVVTDRDMYIALATRDKPASQLTVGDVAAGKVRACGPDDDVYVALDTMATQRIRRLPVTQDGALVGIISPRPIDRRASGMGPPIGASTACAETGRVVRETVMHDLRGFASMDPVRRREIASKGGKAAHAKGTAHEWSPEEAREARRRRGKSVRRPRSRTPLSVDVQSASDDSGDLP